MDNLKRASKVGPAMFAGVVCVALLGPGCGDDTGTGTGGGGTTTATTATTTDATTTTAATGGGGTGGAGTGGAGTCDDIPSPVAGDACDAIAQAYCESWEACNPFVFDLVGGTMAECLLWARAQCVQNVAQPGDTNTAAEHEACAELAIGEPCGCVHDCNLDPVGTLPVGNDCMHGKQCTSGRCQGRKEYVTCGTCVAVAAVTEACDGIDVFCDDGLYCESTGSTCVAKKADGATCTNKGECLNEVCYDGMCSGLLGVGADCSGTNGDSACDLFGLGLRCGPVTQVCEPWPISQLNEACGVVATGDLRFCAGHLVCDATSDTCVPRDALNEACTLLGGGTQVDASTCLPHLHCIGGFCAAPAPLDCQ